MRATIDKAFAAGRLSRCGKWAAGAAGCHGNEHLLRRIWSMTTCRNKDAEFCRPRNLRVRPEAHNILPSFPSTRGSLPFYRPTLAAEVHDASMVNNKNITARSRSPCTWARYPTAYRRLTVLTTDLRLNVTFNQLWQTLAFIGLLTLLWVFLVVSYAYVLAGQSSNTIVLIKNLY